MARMRLFASIISAIAVAVSLSTSSVNWAANASDSDGFNGVGKRPKIIGFLASYYLGAVTVSGDVSDPDSNMAGTTVTIWGDVNGVTNVDNNLHFYTAFANSPPYGTAFAKVSDPEGNQSLTSTTDW